MVAANLTMVEGGTADGIAAAGIMTTSLVKEYA
jgi:hypothetical protein